LAWILRGPGGAALETRGPGGAALERSGSLRTGKAFLGLGLLRDDDDAAGFCR
jgi:hypothetical protein